MFAKVVRQNEEIRQLFNKRIRKKLEEDKSKIKEKADSFMPSFISSIAKPIIDIVCEADTFSKNLKGSGGELNAKTGLYCLLDSKNIVMNDVVLEVEPDEFIQLDHIIFANSGIFIVETKHWSGVYKAYRDSWQVKKNNAWEECKSPTKQNKRHYILFKKWLGYNFENNIKLQNYIYPLVIFYSSWIRANQCCMPVFENSIKAVSYIHSKKRLYLMN